MTTQQYGNKEFSRPTLFKKIRLRKAEILM